MDQILTLREKRARAWDAAKAFLDTKRGNDGLLSAEDVATYEKMESDVVDLGREIDRLERQAAIDRELAKPLNMPLTGKPGTPSGKEKTGRASDEYTQAFWKIMRNRGVGYEIMNGLQITSDPEGGYLVPSEFENTLVRGLSEENVMRKLAKIITTESGDRKIPVVTMSGEASWLHENSSLEETHELFDQVSISAHKVGAMLMCSEELLNDSIFDIEAYLAAEFARRIGAKEEEAFMVGYGNNMPTGIFYDLGGGEPGVTTSGANITADDMIDLYYSLKAPYRKNAAFIMHDSTVKALRKLKDSSGQFLWQPSLTAGAPDTLLNRPVYTSAYAPAIGDISRKAVAFGDFGYYWIADRQGRSFKRLNELYARSGQVGFMASQRVDGRLVLPEAVKILSTKGA